MVLVTVDVEVVVTIEIAGLAAALAIILQLIGLVTVSKGCCKFAILAADV